MLFFDDYWWVGWVGDLGWDRDLLAESIRAIRKFFFDRAGTKKIGEEKFSPMVQIFFKIFGKKFLGKFPQRLTN